MGRKKGSYKLTLDDLYREYVNQYSKSMIYSTNKRKQYGSLGIRLTKTGEAYYDKEMMGKNEFKRAFIDEYTEKDKHESAKQLAQRMAKEEVYDISRGFMKSVEHAYNQGLMFNLEGENLTLRQVKDKMKFDTDFRKKYFDTSKDLYYQYIEAGYSADAAKKAVGQDLYGSP